MSIIECHLVGDNGLPMLSISTIVYKNLTLLSVKELTLYHTVPTFNDPEERALLKTLWEKKKWLPAFSSFPTMFSILSRTNFAICINFIWSSSNAFILDCSKILLSVKELQVAL